MPLALDKAPNTLSKGFAECCTRQWPLGEKMASKAAFAESHLSGTRQSFCRVPSQPSAKKTAQETVTAALPSTNPDGTRQSVLFLIFLKFFRCRALPGMALGKVFNFVFFLNTMECGLGFRFKKNTFAECPDLTLNKLVALVLCRVSGSVTRQRSFLPSAYPLALGKPRRQATAVT